MKKFLTVFGCTLIHLTMGTIYTFSNMSPYLMTYLKTYVNPSLGRTEDFWIYSLTIFSKGSAMWIGGVIQSLIGIRPTLTLGATLFCSGVASTYFSIKWGLWFVLGTYGIMVGVGVGLVYSVALNAAINWWPTHSGLVMGIVVAGFGGGAFFFSYIQTAFINPHNYVPLNGIYQQPDLLANIPNCFLFLALLYACSLTVGIVLTFTPDPVSDKDSDQQAAADSTKTEDTANHKEKEGLEDKHQDENKISPEDINRRQNSVIEVPVPKEERPRKSSQLKDILLLLKHPHFWILWSMQFFLSFSTNIITANYKKFGQAFIHDDKFLAIVASVSALFNAFSRPIIGELCDLVSFKLLLRIDQVGLALTCFALYLTQFMGQWWFMAAVCVYFLFFAAGFVLFPVSTGRIFGFSNLSTKYGLVFTSFAIVSLVAGFLFPLIFEAAGWLGVLIISAASVCISFALSYVLPSSN